MYGFAPASSLCLLFLRALLFANTKNNRYLATGCAKPLMALAFSLSLLVSILFNR